MIVLLQDLRCWLRVELFMNTARSIPKYGPQTRAKGNHLRYVRLKSGLLYRAQRNHQLTDPVMPVPMPFMLCHHPCGMNMASPGFSVCS